MTVRDMDTITYTWITADYFGFHDGYWACSGYGLEGVGDTKEEAYTSWIQQKYDC